MDQNACSSPQLIIWLGKKNKIAKEKFWSTIFKIAKKEYTSSPDDIRRYREEVIKLGLDSDSEVIKVLWTKKLQILITTFLFSLVAMSWSLTKSFLISSLIFSSHLVV